MTKEFAAFALLLAAGLFLANPLILFLSLLPMLFVALSLAFQRPGSITITRGAGQVKADVNDRVELETGIEIGEGRGIVALADPLPGRLPLAGGSGLRVFWKGGKELRERLGYTLHCTRAGSHVLAGSRVESFHFSGLVQTGFERGEQETEILVKHASGELRGMRDPRLFKRVLMPFASVSRTNAPSTDFKEIREYMDGDEFRNINWKATVRTGGLEKGTLLVNDFEKEGTRRVWLFMDGGLGMASGSTVRDAFEYALQASLGLSRFYLARGCEVGLVIYHQGTVLLPDSGRRQESIITDRLLEAGIGLEKEPLERTVRKCGGHIAGTNPLFLIITRLSAGGAEELRNGIRQMRRISGKRSRIVILHVSGGDEPVSATERAAERITELRLLPVLGELRRSGSYLITWDPVRQDFRELITSILGRGVGG